MVGETIRQNLQMRLDNTKSTINREVELLKAIPEGLKQRFGRDPQEPSLPRGMGGLMGSTTGIAEMVPAFVVRTGDNFQTHLLGFARANRALIRR